MAVRTFPEVLSKMRGKSVAVVIIGLDVAALEGVIEDVGSDYISITYPGHQGGEVLAYLPLANVALVRELPQ